MGAEIPLVEALQAHIAGKRVRLHMPGHKGQAGASIQLVELLGHKVFAADMTEVAGLDDLHNPQGVIGRAQKLAAAAFGAYATFFLINGATAGIEAALMAVSRPGDVVLAPRNVHRSFLNGLILSGAKPAYIETRFTSQGVPLPVAAGEISEALQKHPQAKIIFIASPTYEGLGLNYDELMPVIKKAGLKVIVD